MKALIIVDLQNEFLPFGMQPVDGIVELIEEINSKAANFDRVVATQLWYPANHQRFAANHPWRHPGGEVEIDGVVQDLYEYYCVQDTFGAALISSLDQSRIDRIFYRGSQADKDSHSVFFDKKEQPTGLMDYLKSEGVDEIELMGVDREDTFQKSIEEWKSYNNLP